MREYSLHPKFKIAIPSMRNIMPVRPLVAATKSFGSV